MYRVMGRAETRSEEERHGFTLVEIMIVVAVIGLLAGIAIPSLTRARINARVSRMANDLRTFAAAFEMHNLDQGHWPTDVNRGIIPPSMQGYLRGSAFTQPTPIGGNWDWDFNMFGIRAGISVVDPIADDLVLLKIDTFLDNGNLATGRFRRTAARRHTFVLEE